MVIRTFLVNRNVINCVFYNVNCVENLQLWKLLLKATKYFENTKYVDKKLLTKKSVLALSNFQYVFEGLKCNITQIIDVRV